MSDLLLFVLDLAGRAAACLLMAGIIMGWARDFRRAWLEGKRRRSEFDRVVRRERAR